jgi:hypothetical protein
MTGGLYKHAVLALVWNLPQNQELYRYLNGYFFSLPQFQGDMQMWASEGEGDFNNELYTGYNLDPTADLNLTVRLAAIRHDESYDKPKYVFYVDFKEGTKTVNDLNTMLNEMVMEIHRVFNINIDPNDVVVDTLNFDL